MRASPIDRSGSVRHRLSAAQSLSACTRARSSTPTPESVRNAPVANDDTKSTTCSPSSADTSVHVWNAATSARARNTDSTWRPVAASVCTIRNHGSVASSDTRQETGRSRAPIVESTCRNPPGNRPCPIVVSSTNGCGSSGPSASAPPAGTKDTSAAGWSSPIRKRAENPGVTQSAKAPLTVRRPARANSSPSHRRRGRSRWCCRSSRGRGRCPRSPCGRCARGRGRPRRAAGCSRAAG